MPDSSPKIAIIADWLTTMGGGEQVVMALSDLYPDAPVYTSIYHDNFPSLRGRDVRPTYLQRLPDRLRRKHQFLLPLLPDAFSRLDLSGYDVIISSSSAFSKCITKQNPEQIHICYCHSPTRFLYHAREEYISSYPLPAWMSIVKPLLPKLLDYLTRRDQDAAKQVDYFMCNSDYIKRRVECYYHRDATTIYPCVDTTRYKSAKGRGEYFLALGRFIPYKKFDLLVRTFAENRLPLKLAGIGPQLEENRALAKSLNAENITFTGFVEDDDLPALYANARAFLFPAEEDFGLTPVEAMASGVPVIAYGEGGATESVTPECGILFAQQSVSSLQQAIERFIRMEEGFDKTLILANAARFDKIKFQQQIAAFVSSVVK
jgi:glycosyltransferase involved in cell wall biosynthesis